MTYPVGRRAHNFRDLAGQRFGRWQVLRLDRAAKRPSGKRTVYWLCQCVCGTVKPVMTTNLTSGKSTNCGCYRETHGMTGTLLHRIWKNMNQRCTNPKATETVSRD
jgi:hypothetical protein